jgi:hypothetical protein
MKISTPKTKRKQKMKRLIFTMGKVAT